MYKAFSDEPMRLLEKDEPRAAFISAFSLLEIELNHYFENENASQKSRAVPIFMLIKDAHSKKILDKEQFQNLIRWLSIRNKVIHTKEGESERISVEMVHGIMNIVDVIREASKRSTN